MADPVGVMPEAPQDSPLLELVDYINEHMACLAEGTAEPGFSAQSGSLRLRGRQLEAQVGPFVLRSVERSLVAPREGGAVRGYGARVEIRLPSGREITPDMLFRLQSSPPAVVAMDRLCRVLHMLQHLGYGRDGQDLWLHVGLLHVLAVEQRHGEFFENLLRRCGLGPECIVLIMPVVALDDPAYGRLARACANYRERGYRLALDLRGALLDDQRAAAVALGADWWRVHAREAALLGGALEVEGVLLRGAGASGGVATQLNVVRVLSEVSSAGLPEFSF